MQIRIVHLYPDLLNLYGDRGNITCLQKRCEWRSIEVVVTEHKTGDPLNLDETDILFLGGGSDREQKIVANYLQAHKNELRDYIENDGVLIAVCGGYQLIGHYYQSENEKIEGLSLVDIYTVSEKKRLIGNVVIQSDMDGLQTKIAGFENHAGRTYVGSHTPLGTVVCGYGNNAQDSTEGIIYKNTIGTYLHGPLFPKNPELADFVITKALERRYGEEILLPELDDFEEARANAYAVSRFSTKSS